ncbi:hypothetical protein GCM10027053_24900 [Intrasporangium mesophilum]
MAGAAVAALSLVLASCSSADPAASSGTAPAAGGWQAVVDAANKEGEVVFYSSDSDSINKAVVEAFEKAYPNIKVNLVKAGPDIAARVSTEKQSGINSGDVLSTGFQDLVENTEWFIPLDKTVLPTLGEQTWPDNMIGKTKTWVAKYVQYLGVAWNTAEVKGDGLNTWSDLLKPEFKGTVTLPDPRATSTNISWLDAVSNALGDDYVKKVYELQPKIEAGGSVPASQDVAAGAQDVSFPQSSMLIADLSTKGAPIAFRVLTDPLVEVPGQLAVFKDAPHPNAARVFANFRVSPQGMSAVCVAAGPPGQTGFAAPFTEPVQGCYTKPDGKEAIQGNKNLSPKDERYLHILSLLGLKPKTS